MSTKIYNGIMLNNVYTIQDMQDFMESIKGPVKEAVFKQRARDILHTACLIYDMHHVMGQDYFNPDENKRIPLLVSSRRHVMLPKDEATSYDVGIAIVDGYTLGMYFFDDPESEKIILGHPQVQYFGYWNNTDPDNEVTAEEWELRKELWTNLFKNSGYPAEAMFTQRILNTQYIMPEDHHMESAIPTLEERRKTIIKNVSFALAKEEMKEENGGEDIDYSKGGLGKLFDRAEEKNKIATQAVPVSKFTEKLTLAKLSIELPVPENNNEKEEEQDDGNTEST